jgi:hypothetical protein
MRTLATLALAAMLAFVEGCANQPVPVPRWNVVDRGSLGFAVSGGQVGVRRMTKLECKASSCDVVVAVDVAQGVPCSIDVSDVIFITKKADTITWTLRHQGAASGKTYKFSAIDPVKVYFNDDDVTDDNPPDNPDPQGDVPYFDPIKRVNDYTVTASVLPNSKGKAKAFKYTISVEAVPLAGPHAICTLDPTITNKGY